METKSTTVRDVFLHLLSIVALYLASFAFGRLLFSIINVSIPDALAYNGGEYESLRFSIATMIVVFPFYFFVTRFLVRTRQQPEYQDVRIRKWLIYLTLSLAAITIISDLVTFLYWLLDGDVTLRFILKVGAVLLIAATVFYYYFWELNARVPAIRAFVIGTIVVIVLGVILGFWFIGSPMQRRAQRFDERRVQDLEIIQYAVVNYWQRKQRLPNELGDLRDSISGFISPMDPESGSPYEYRASGPVEFELCAVFSTAGVEQGPRKIGDGQWLHGIGKTCFVRTIDPQLYPPPGEPKGIDRLLRQDVIGDHP